MLGAQEKAYSRALLAGGVLMFSVSWKGKKPPQEKGATTFILLDYDAYSDVTPYMPSTGNLV